VAVAFVERPAGTLEPYGCSPRLLPPDSISRWRVVEVAAALGLPLSAARAVAIAALAGPLDLGGGPPEAGPDLVGLQFGDRPLLFLGVSQLRCRSRPVTITRSPLGKGVGQVLGLPAPDVDAQVGGVAVAQFGVVAIGIVGLCGRRL
jgi:hypothetical protein